MKITFECECGNKEELEISKDGYIKSVRFEMYATYTEDVHLKCKECEEVVTINIIGL